MIDDSEDCYAKESILIVGAGELGTAVLKSVAGHSARKAKVGGIGTAIGRNEPA